MSLPREIQRILDVMEPKARDAFLAVFKRLRKNVDLSRVAAYIEAQDVSALIGYLGLDRDVFEPLEKAIVDTYSEGGRASIVKSQAGAKSAGFRAVEVTFGYRTPGTAAERWVREFVGDKIQEIIDDQKALIRQAIERGLSQGQNPLDTARGIIGKINPLTGRREGGSLGLSSYFEDIAARNRADLSSGSTEALQRYLGRSLRDKRFDATVRKALEEGKALDKDFAAKLADRYEDRLLAYRGRMVARTETLSAVHAGRKEGFSQFAAKNNVSPEFIKRRWRSAGDDGHTRDTHLVLGSVPQYGVRYGLDTPFLSPSGARLMHPLDSSLGAGPEEIINCRCWEDVEIDFVAIQLAKEADQNRVY